MAKLSLSFPITRPKRDPDAYRGPRPGVGQTVMFCPVDRKTVLFDFTQDDQLQCVHCRLVVER